MSTNVLDSYTIFDNFDKLDLSPIAYRFETPIETAFGSSFVNIDGSKYTAINENSSQTVNNIICIKSNETIYANERMGDARIAQQIEPYNMTVQNFGSLGTYVPDMFRYVTSRRFFIDRNLKIRHTFDASKESQNPHYINNLFDLDFYFQFIDTRTLNIQMRSNNFLYSKMLNNLPPSSQEFVGLSQYLSGMSLQGGISTAFDGVLEGLQNPFLFGGNRMLFVYDKNKNRLLPKDAIPGVFPATQIKYLVYDSKKPERYLNNLLILLQRLLYPIATTPTLSTRHIYFVADLKKSAIIEVAEEVLPYIDADYKSVRVLPSYNYYQPYAEGFSSNVKSEWQLPNAYTYYSFLNSKNDNKFFNYYSNLIKVTPYGKSTENLSPGVDTQMSLERYYQYTDASTPMSETTTNPFGDNAVANPDAAKNLLNLYKNRNIVFGQNAQNIFKEVDSIKDIFPYYNKVELPSIKSDLANKLQKQGFLDAFMSFIGNYFGDRAVDIIGKAAPGGVDYRKGALHTFSGFLSHGAEANLFASTMQVLDLTSVSSQLADYKNYLFDDTLIKFGSNSLTLPEKQEDCILSSYNISALIDVFMDYCKNKYVTYKDIDEGKKCYSEMLGFEVVKSKTDDKGNKQIVQSFFIPCVGDNPLSYIDTQVFYDTEYVYEVYSLSLVVGTEYSSELEKLNTATPQFNPLAPPGFAQPPEPLSPEETTNETGIIQFSLQTKLIDYVNNYTDSSIPFGDSMPLLQKDTTQLIIPKPIIVRAPFYNNTAFGFQKQTKLMDKPPLPPEITFYPYKDVDNKVLILLNVNYGERKMFPIQVFFADIGRIGQYYKSQEYLEIDKNSHKKRILYKTDDFLGTYKIYRTNKTPAKWSDFDPSPHAEISNSQNSGFQSDVLPNVDYYYFARFEDVHGNFSNPTEIFKIRIVKEGGFPPYMIVKTYDFSETRESFVREKSFKKYLKIRLADGVRKYINLNNINKAAIGYSKAMDKINPDFKKLRSVNTAQLKKYKIRITSKQTGKKMDINLDFKRNISDQFLTKEIQTEKQSLAKELINKNTSKIENKTTFINMTETVAKHDEKSKDFKSADDPVGGNMMNAFISSLDK